MSALLSPGTSYPPAGGASTWNPLDKASTLVLSGGNLTATCSPAGDAAVRGTTSKTSGKLHFEVTINSAGAFPSYPEFGLANGSADLNADLGTADDNSVDVDPTGGVYVHNVSLGSIDAYGVGNTVALEIDFSLAQIWITKLGGTGRKGPFSVSALGATLYAIAQVRSTSDSITINFGATAFAITPTSGFSAWG